MRELDTFTKGVVLTVSVIALIAVSSFLFLQFESISETNKVTDPYFNYHFTL